jgi:TP901-1 family phage major tail protein
MMAAKAGNDFVLRRRASTNPDVFEDVSGNRALSMSIGNEEVNVTTKDEGGWRQLLEGGGEKGVSISTEGVFTGGDQQKALRDAAMSGAHEVYQVDDGDEILEGEFQVTNFDQSGDVNQEQAYSASLESSGTPTVS